MGVGDSERQYNQFSDDATFFFIDKLCPSPPLPTDAHKWARGLPARSKQEKNGQWGKKLGNSERQYTKHSDVATLIFIGHLP